MKNGIVERLKLDIERNVKNTNVVLLKGKSPGLLATGDGRAIHIALSEIEDSSNPTEIDLILIDTERKQSYAIYMLEVTKDILPDILNDILSIIKDYQAGKYSIINKRFLFLKQQTLVFENPLIVHREATKTKGYIDPTTLK